MDDRAAVTRIRAERNPVARASLLTSFLHEKEGLIRHLTQKAAAAEKTTEDLDDLYQCGRMGFVQALETWDPDKGALSTWAGWRIKRCVQDAAKAAQPIALPQIRGTVEERNRIIHALREDPDVTPEALGIKPSMLERIKRSIGLRYVSVDMFAESSSGDDGPSRARRLERRIAETMDDEDPEGEVDQRGAVQRALDAIRSLPMSPEEVLAGLGRVLGCSPEPMKPPAQKAQPSCPKPPPKSCLTVRALPRVTLALRAGASEAGAQVRSRLLSALHGPPRRRLSVRALPRCSPITKRALPSSPPTSASRPSSKRTSASGSLSLLRAA